MRKVLVATVALGLFFSSVALAGPTRGGNICGAGTSHAQTK